MKLRIFTFLIALSTVCFGQKAIPVVKATSKTAWFAEGTEERTSWGIDPKAKPDVKTVSKLVKPKWISFYTDIDSIKVKLKPGEKFDFIVLLNGKDSCLTRIESQAKNYASIAFKGAPDTIPFILTAYNNIKMKTVVNGKDTLFLKFDSGTTGLLLTNEVIGQRPGMVKAAAQNTLNIGKLKWDNLEVYPVELSGQGTDGRFGWDLFDGKVVEIDYDRSIFVVHSKLPEIAGGYSRFPIEYTHTLFCITGELQIKEQRYTSRFLFDNGYQRTIMMDTLLMQDQHYPKDLEVIKKTIMRNGQGKEIPVYTVNNERLNLGKSSLFNIPVQLLATANPARFKTHILGNEVLKRYNTFLDFQKNYVYLRPNSLFKVPYTDAKKS